MDINACSSYLKSKPIAGLLVLLCIGFLTLYGGVQLNNSPQRCLACHSMKPEYFTWKASTHGKANVSCVSCHSPPGIAGFIRAKAKGFKEIYYTATNSYVAPVRMLESLEDPSCERCHNMNKRGAVSSGDIISRHDVHKKRNVHCAKCHGGIAHGKISDRKVTYRSDYQRWDHILGESLMSEVKFTQPDMDMCIKCHQLRKAPLTCKTCHKSSKVPDNHKKGDFKYKTHGRQAAKDLRYCDSCHNYMSEEQVNNLKEPEKFIQYLEQRKPQQPPVSAATYSKSNTHCKTCHGKRPPGHGADFIESHRLMAKRDQNRCATCHDNQEALGPKGTKLTQLSADSLVTKTTCGSCHPSIHANSVQWKRGYHPVQLPARPRITKSCYVCHSEQTCSGCHGRLK